MYAKADEDFTAEKHMSSISQAFIFNQDKRSKVHLGEMSIDATILVLIILAIILVVIIIVIVICYCCNPAEEPPKMEEKKDEKMDDEKKDEMNPDMNKDGADGSWSLLVNIPCGRAASNSRPQPIDLISI